ncbi:MAG: hypothetical protein FWE64_03210 [Alphaproteobacteria bacterium]|nr:hypothetical protein [Alphaproteobacteria bacterium]
MKYTQSGITITVQYNHRGVRMKGKGAPATPQQRFEKLVKKSKSEVVCAVCGLPVRKGEHFCVLTKSETITRQKPVAHIYSCPRWRSARISCRETSYPIHLACYDTGQKSK